ncbi:MAG: hypothetical protein AABM40_05830 [Chloroflexota bacterium]
MTISWAASCVDGVVVASDSMWVHKDRTPGAVYSGALSEHKLGMVAGRFAYAISGVFDGALGISPSFGAMAALDDVAAAMFRELAGRQLPQFPREDGELSEDDEFGLLIGGGRAGSRPEVLSLRSNPQRVVRVPIGGIVDGALLGYGDPEPLQLHGPDLTVADAIAIGARRSLEYCRHLYRACGLEHLEDFRGLFGEKGQPIPPAAFPLQIAVITANTMRRFEAYAPDEDDLRAVLGASRPRGRHRGTIAVGVGA